MALAHDTLTLTEQRLTSAEPISDEAFLAIAGHYEEWRVELDGAYTVVLMAPHSNDTSILNATLIALMHNWNAALTNPGVVFDSDTRFRWPERSLKGPDTAWLSSDRECERKAAGKTFGEIIPEIVVELRSQTDGWKAQLARCDQWVQAGALYAIAIDPYEHRLECTKSAAAASSAPFAAELEAVTAIARKVAGIF